MRRIRLAGLALTLAFGRAMSADAQTLALDFGGAVMRQEGISGAAAMAAANLRIVHPRQALLGSALAIASEDGSGSVQAGVTGMLFAPAPNLFRWELSASVFNFAETGDAPVVGADVLAREYFGTIARGLFAGVGGGPSASGGISWPTSEVDAGGWWRIADEQFTATVTRTSTTVGLVTTFSGGGSVQRNSRIRSTDAVLAWRGDLGPAALSASAGARDWLGRREDYGSASAAVRVTPQAAVVASIGRALEDVARGVPSTRYMSVALRIIPGEAARTPSPPHVERIAGPTISAARAADTTCIITVRAPAAQRVEIMADFTDWEPLALEHVGTDWQLARAIEPGPHRLVIRVDNGAWQVPANLPHVDGDLGMDVGLITVP